MTAVQTVWRLEVFEKACHGCCFLKVFDLLLLTRALFVLAADLTGLTGVCAVPAVWSGAASGAQCSPRFLLVLAACVIVVQQWRI